MLFLAQGKGFYRLFRVFFHSFAKSSVVVRQIEQLVDLIDTHLSLLQFPYGVAGAVVVFQKQGPGLSQRAGEGNPVQQLAAVVAGSIDALFGGATGQRSVSRLTLSVTGLSKRAGEGNPVQQLAAVFAGSIDALFGGATGQRLVFPLNQQTRACFLPLTVGPAP